MVDHDVLEHLSNIKHQVQLTQLEILAIIEADAKTGLRISRDVAIKTRNGQDEIYDALMSVSDSLARSYAQIKVDIKDNSRISWAGTAHEIREVLATLLRLLAPDDILRSESWFKQEPETSGPTQKQRVHYILLKNGAGSKERQVVEQVVNLETLIEDLVRLTYARASDAAHRFKPRSEVAKLLRYFEAFAYDLLDLNE